MVMRKLTEAERDELLLNIQEDILGTKLLVLGCLSHAVLGDKQLIVQLTEENEQKLKLFREKYGFTSKPSDSRPTLFERLLKDDKL
jgi:hypothetical protein